MIRILVMAADRSACGHYRLIWPAEAIDEPGIEVTVADETTLGIMLNGMGEVIGVSPPDADVLVIQRPLDYRWPRVIELLRDRHKVAVVVDMDDRFDCIAPRHVGFAGFSPTHSPLSNWNHAAAACTAASLVTVSTPALVDVYGAGRVLPNCIPEAWLDIDVAPTRSIGWPGWVGSHPDDLTVVRAGVANVVRKTGWPVRVIGPGDDVARQLGLEDDAVEATGFVPFAEWPEAVASIGVGIAPLRSTAFNFCKSRLKILELAALGIPAIGSPVPDYIALAEMGAGIIAEKPKDWERELRRLIEDEDHWVECSARGRAVAATLTVEEHAWRWAAAWAEAADTR